MHYIAIKKGYFHFYFERFALVLLKCLPLHSVKVYNEVFK